MQLMVCCSLWTSPQSSTLDLALFDYIQHDQLLVSAKFGQKCAPPVYGKEVTTSFGFAPPFVTL